MKPWDPRVIYLNEESNLSVNRTVTSRSLFTLAGSPVVSMDMMWLTGVLSAVGKVRERGVVSLVVRWHSRRPTKCPGLSHEENAQARTPRHCSYASVPLYLLHGTTPGLAFLFSSCLVLIC